MLYLQGKVLLPAIGAGARPLVEQILAQLVACKCALLILASLNLGVLHRLEVEANQLHAYRFNGAQSHQSLYPGGDIADATLKRGR